MTLNVNDGEFLLSLRLSPRRTTSKSIRLCYNGPAYVDRFTASAVRKASGRRLKAAMREASEILRDARLIMGANREYQRAYVLGVLDASPRLVKACLWTAFGVKSVACR